MSLFFCLFLHVKVYGSRGTFSTVVQGSLDQWLELGFLREQTNLFTKQSKFVRIKTKKKLFFLVSLVVPNSDDALFLTCPAL